MVRLRGQRPPAGWTSARRATSRPTSPALFAIGECDYQFHGANRLGANSLVACMFSGLIVAPGMVDYAGSLPGGKAAEQPSSLFDRAVDRHQADYQAPAGPARRAARTPTRSTPNWAA